MRTASKVQNIFIALTVLATAALAYLTLSAPTPSAPTAIPGLDKAYHVGAFFILAACASLAFPGRWKSSLAFALVYGAAIEIAQPSFGRSMEFMDLVADAAGAGLGLLTVLVFRAALRANPLPT